jgi:transcriptional regulator with XRE-family HTH domain
VTMALPVSSKDVPCFVGVLWDTIIYVIILLRHWRERRGYSARGLATQAGVGYVSIVRIENGHMSPTVDMLEKLAAALDISVRDFFPREGIKQKRR